MVVPNASLVRSGEHTPSTNGGDVATTLSEGLSPVVYAGSLIIYEWAEHLYPLNPWLIKSRQVGGTLKVVGVLSLLSWKTSK